MDIAPLFTGNDLRLIESLQHDPDLKPCFDVLRDCLIWTDERPNGLSPEGYEALLDLWIARSFLHQGKSFSTHSLDPHYFEDIWTRALSQGFKWPGFQRLELSDEQKAFFESEKQAAASETNI